ncbi:hypothetical protein FQR65_LT07004 [Abscondita terminalis]|nr:hypothetical protein FQR65_LT07004 [Abscondita terminalis]
MAVAGPSSDQPPVPVPGPSSNRKDELPVLVLTSNDRQKVPTSVCLNINDLILDFDDGSSAIKELKFLLNNKELPHQFQFIKANYAFVSTTLVQLQEGEVPITEAITKVKNLQSLKVILASEHHKNWITC